MLRGKLKQSILVEVSFPQANSQTCSSCIDSFVNATATNWTSYQEEVSTKATVRECYEKYDGGQLTAFALEEMRLDALKRAAYEEEPLNPLE
jgi:hypothetical protein